MGNGSNHQIKALKVQSLTKEYRSGFWGRKVCALNGLNLEVDPGEIFGYLGTNGAGKTTTIKTLVGLMKPTQGSAEIFGRSISNPHTRKNIGFLPENPYFYEYLNAEESLRFYYSLSLKPDRQLNKRISEILELLELSHARYVRVRDYSKGMRQRLGIAQSIIHEPKIIFLDEPLSGLDPVGRLLIRNIIFRLKDLGITVFFSSHILSDVEMICDRIGLLRKGKLVNCGYLSEILSTKTQKNEYTLENVNPDSIEMIKNISERTVIEGNRVRVIIQDGEKSKMAWDLIVKKNITLVSLIPQKETLEEYFIRVESRDK